MFKTTLLAFATALALSLSTLAADAGGKIKGAFVGASDHITTGNVIIEKRGDGYVAILDEAFTLDGAPDPRVAFGNDGDVSGAVFAKLKSKTGKQEYAIPANINPANFNEFHIWCSKFSVPLGIAKLSSK
ncbi:MAG: DM13 domain-containing protein [Rhodobacteraceae bacterium]|nr:DM13 domain-containing protein [Paracoccaceae bacterium]